MSSSKPEAASISEADNGAGSGGGGISKKQAKKEAKKAEKAQRQQSSGAQAVEAESSDDPLSSHYGDVAAEEIQSKAVSGREWTEVGDLGAEKAGRTVLIRGAAQAIRPVSKKMAFLVLRQAMSTVQCVLVADARHVSPHMVKFATALSRESILDVEGVVSVPSQPIKGSTQQVLRIHSSRWSSSS